MYLPVDFFEQEDVKQLRKMEKGDRYLVIYMEMLDLSAPAGNQVFLDKDDTLEQNIADFYEEDVEDVKAAIKYLTEHGRIHKMSSEPTIYFIGCTRTAVSTNTIPGKPAEE